MYATYIDLIKKYRWFVAGGVVIIVLIAVGAYFAFRKPPLPVDAPSEFKSANFSFTYPRLYTAQEHGDGSVALGGTTESGFFIPLIDIVRYKSDPDQAVPASFETFAARQAEALCGSDGGVRLACTTPVTKMYTTSTGLVGEIMTLTLVATDLKTGTTTSSTYGPIYIYNTTAPATVDDPLRYQAVFVYPDFSSFILASSSASLVPDVASTITITKGSFNATTSPISQ